MAKIAFTVLITALIVGGGVYFLQKQSRNVVAEKPVQADEGSKLVQANATTTEETRELIPHGYVIADKLFFSPTLGLSFTGQLKTLEFKNDEFRAQDWPGVIKVFQKNSGQDVISAIQEVVKKGGGNVDECDFTVNEQGNGNAYVMVTPKIAYEPSSAELLTFRKKTNPEIKTVSNYNKFCENNIECQWDKQSLVQAHNQKVCSSYAVSNSYHDGSYFQFSTEASGSDNFVYVHSEVGGGDASWIGHIDVFPK